MILHCQFVSCVSSLNAVQFDLTQTRIHILSRKSTYTIFISLSLSLNKYRWYIIYTYIYCLYLLISFTNGFTFLWVQNQDFRSTPNPPRIRERKEGAKRELKKVPKNLREELSESEKKRSPMNVLWPAVNPPCCFGVEHRGFAGFHLRLAALKMEMRVGNFEKCRKSDEVDLQQTVNQKRVETTIFFSNSKHASLGFGSHM